MKVVCPCTDGLRQETLDCLLAANAAGVRVEFRNVRTSPTAYAELITELWAERRGFLIVEEDMSFTVEQLQSLIKCDRPYCANPYEWTTNIGPALGFTKFGARVLRDVPTPNLHGVAWNQVDYVLMRTILGRTHHRQPHLHLPPVQHLNEEKSPLRPEFQTLTLADHLAALGYEISDDGATAEYRNATFEFGEIDTKVA